MAGGAGAGCVIRWGGERLTLLPERAVWWPRRRTVLVADVHLGKDQVFRRHGIGVPAGPTGADLAALEQLVSRLRADRLVVLGDLVHAPPAPGDRWPEAVGAWRQRLADVTVRLVLGNHDRRLRPWLEGWGLEAAPSDRLEPFSLVHEPDDAGAGPALCGHLHPVVKLRDGRRGSLRLPVFWFSPHRGVLPAFGGFTGGQRVTPAPGDALYAVGRRAVLPLQHGAPPSAATPARPPGGRA